MLSRLSRLIPRSTRLAYRNMRRSRENARNEKRTTEDVFTDIYTNNLWGGEPDGFCSGPGTVDDRVTGPYLELLHGERIRPLIEGRVFVDLGCGDFRVGRELLPLCDRYIGVDIVEPLIDQHRARYATNEQVDFAHLDIINEPLPEGDVCFVRQVLQHLSNDQIGLILPKLAAYDFVFITEHYPTPNHRVRPNLDKAHGGGVRVERNSGVYLEEAPFSLPEDRLTLLLEVAGHAFNRDDDPGVIRTYLYTPKP